MGCPVDGITSQGFNPWLVIPSTGHQLVLCLTGSPRFRRARNVISMAIAVIGLAIHSIQGGHETMTGIEKD